MEYLIPRFILIVQRVQRVQRGGDHWPKHSVSDLKYSSDGSIFLRFEKAVVD